MTNLRGDSFPHVLPPEPPDETATTALDRGAHVTVAAEDGATGHTEYLRDYRALAAETDSRGRRLVRVVAESDWSAWLRQRRKRQDPRECPHSYLWPATHVWAD